MRFVHSRGFIHRNLTPDAVLLDWDWNVRLSHFGSAAAPGRATDSGGANSGDARYRAPECYEDAAVPESDVFAFGLILFEAAAGRPAFARAMRQAAIAGAVVLREWELALPPDVSLPPATAALITDCCARNFRERPSFSEIVARLEGMRFEVVEGVNSAKVAGFVEQIKAEEVAIDAEELERDRPDI
jgi:serine/threonine protein kinase